MTILSRLSAAVMAAALLTTGCILKEEQHTWYLDPNSSAVTWAVSEHNVRSDAKAPADRDAEELTFWTDVQAGSHSTARAFRMLGAWAQHTRVLRAERPYSIVTEASFTTLEELGRQIISRGGLSGTSVLERDAATTTWTLTARDPHAEAPDVDDDDVMELLAALDTLRVVLVEGRFTSAAGFHLSSDRSVAIIELPEDEPDGFTVVLRLQWE